MSDERRQFQIYLPGLLKVLAESLYSSKKVAIRELLQNAHDSCVRRRVEHKDPSYKPRVDVSVDRNKRTITIRDNGSGLTADEVGDYLSTIGRSYTRQLGEDLAILSPEEASKLIGQFGLGFLSAFLIAESVELVTHSAKPDNPTLQWHSEGDVHYDLKTVEDGPVGTSVTLHVKPSASFLLNGPVLIETIQQFADFLPVPVYVEGNSMPANAMTPPWHSVDPQIAMREYIGRAFGTQNPLAIIPLDDQEIDLGHDTMTIPMEGFLFVPPGSIASIQEYGDMTVFIRRMFITERQRDLLPTWARFVRGVIDCPYLQPTASREDIQQQETFPLVQQALERQLISGLRKLAETEPGTWRKIVRGHRNVIMGWAVKDNTFFDDIADIITWRTSRGLLTLPEYLKLTENTAYFVTRELGSLQEQLLGEGYGVPVIDASLFAEPSFLRKYAHHNPDVKLVQLDNDSNQLLHAVPEEEFLPLLSFYRERGVRTRLVSFKPEDVPAVIMYPRDAEFIKETRDALDADELPGPFAGMVGDYISRMNVDEDAMRGTLHLNAGNPLVKQLAASNSSETRDASLELIYQMARLFSGRMLDTSQTTDAFRQSSAAIRRLLGGES